MGYCSWGKCDNPMQKIYLEFLLLGASSCQSAGPILHHSTLRLEVRHQLERRRPHTGQQEVGRQTEVHDGVEGVGKWTG